MRESAFHAYFERHHASLSRLAFLMTGESDVADASAFLGAWAERNGWALRAVAAAALARRSLTA